ncbi:WD domain, G-beta repeat containing protein [Entamoeba histolytica HM-1:IMSS-B]|uniref:WD repeat protein n=5 Tax=Entamoeba histolytica TaxID=5759 RepID=C4LZ38_ENTH1|nr:WD repeat protein [Entamoeba histolytica HM-1:IMSS]EMH74756.1 WD domain, G-beta repeat containing protein [Entamoeba histolytica HM-1:IMSS-B]EMS12772.1 WD repeat domain phosphoinositide-interacting protein, putative [Entamoeba histolytica HM-3:IMSS]ENY62276.1 WD repeat domain phosphoinositide-interacting protein [Entamoeba histolytica HM-1:IMSS-A]GAT94111.1 wd repeat protein [Entamoeba histolytica]EAL49296.1 WD repeat protein [Entamoeba histolytica HM-1:IMSS]|eukprot:XP_654677.1 WD repeat protein [Entamoeba histolytica HM-1:IMSS]
MEAPKILTISVNQDFSCFAIGTTFGFRVFGIENGRFRERFKRTLKGGVGIIELYHKSNMLALVGGGTNPAYEPNKVIIWDDYQGKPFGILDYPTEVRAVKLQKNYLFVVVDKKIYVYNFKDLRPLYQYDTGMNNKGLIAVSNDDGKMIAFPSYQEGSIKLVNLETQSEREVQAHIHMVSTMAFSPDSRSLVTASAQGTLLRVWDTNTLKQKNEFRRGQSQADVYSLNFSPNSELIVTNSNRGTVHIYGVEGDSENYNRPSRLSLIMKDTGLYSKCECTMESDVFTLVFFHCPQLQHISIIGISQTGKFIKYQLTKKEDQPVLVFEESLPLDPIYK